MKLPNLQNAYVPKEKLTPYLLNSDHPVGGVKAYVFMRFGFSVEAWRTFADALRRHARENEVSGVKPTSHGEHYIIEGPLFTPSGRYCRVRSVWYIEQPGGSPRLVTAVPIDRAR